MPEPNTLPKRLAYAVVSLPRRFNERRPRRASDSHRSPGGSLPVGLAKHNGAPARPPGKSGARPGKGLPARFCF